MDILSTKVDQFINLKFNDIVNNSPKKGWGEKTLLLHALDSLTEEYRYIYKMTGRYVLQNTIEWADSDLFTFSKTNDYGMSNGIHTFFYRIPSSKLSMYKEIIESFNTEECIENYIATKLDGNITYIGRIGILCKWSCKNFTTIY